MVGLNSFCLRIYCLEIKRSYRTGPLKRLVFKQRTQDFSLSNPLIPEMVTGWGRRILLPYSYHHPLDAFPRFPLPDSLHFPSFLRAPGRPSFSLSGRWSRSCHCCISESPCRWNTAALDRGAVTTESSPTVVSSWPRSPQDHTPCAQLFCSGLLGRQERQLDSL